MDTLTPEWKSLCICSTLFIKRAGVSHQEKPRLWGIRELSILTMEYNIKKLACVKWNKRRVQVYKKGSSFSSLWVFVFKTPLIYWKFAFQNWFTRLAYTWKANKNNHVLPHHVNALVYFVFEGMSPKGLKFRGVIWQRGFEIISFGELIMHQSIPAAVAPPPH